MNNNPIKILILSLLILQVSHPDSEAAGSGSITITVTLKEAVFVADVSIRLSPRNRRVRPGRTISLQARIRNMGNGDDHFKLTASSSLGWDVNFPQGDTTGLIEPGGRETIPIQVSVPEDANRGDSNILTITATSQFDPSVSDSFFSTLIVR